MSSRSHQLFILSLGWACVLASTHVCSAQEAPRFAIDQLHPSERGSEWFTNESLDLRGAQRPSAGAVMAWSYRSLVVRNDDGSIRESPVRNFASLHLGGSLVIVDRLRVAIDMPVQLYEDGVSSAANGRVFPSPSDEQGVGDLRIGGDVRLFGRHRAPITGAIGLQAWLPTGQQSQWASDGSLRVRPRAMIAGTDRIFVYSAQISLGYRARSESLGPDSGAIGSDAGAALAFGVRLADQVVVGPEAFASTVLDDAFAKRSSSVEALFGAHWLIADTLRVGAGFGRGLTGTVGSPAQRFLFSAEWAPAMLPRDTDRDGIVDTDDACPLVFGIHTTDRRTNGCPADRDHDGIIDSEDACVDVPGIRSPYPNENGCPSDRDHDGIWDISDACPDRRGLKTSDPATNGCPPDADHDGVPDDVDACPRVPGIATNDPKTTGCPPDTDGDGVDDLDDACPTAFGIKTSDPKTNGCPDPDRDKDGIPNDVDACPNDPGPAHPDPKKNGCPKAFVRGDQIAILEPVRFKGGGAEIADTSTSVLEIVAKVMSNHPEIKKVRIEGHTDNRGGPTAPNATNADDPNKKLGLARATSVMKWLLTHGGGGIEPSRLSSVGVGSERPIDTNETEAGRANNRRIELHIEP